MISSCWGVLTYDWQTDKQTDICDCRVAFATENHFTYLFKALENIESLYRLIKIKLPHKHTSFNLIPQNVTLKTIQTTLRCWSNSWISLLCSLVIFEIIQTIFFESFFFSFLVPYFFKLLSLPWKGSYTILYHLQFRQNTPAKVPVTGLIWSSFSIYFVLG